MPSEFHESKLTAYVLGELEEAERLELEHRIASSEELQRQVAAIRATAHLVREAYKAEPAETLTPRQRATIGAASRATTRRRRLWPVWAGGALATAATIVIGLVVVRPGALPPGPTATPALHEAQKLPEIQRRLEDQLQALEEARRSQADSRTPLERERAQLEAQRRVAKDASTAAGKQQQLERGEREAMLALGYVDHLDDSGAERVRLPSAEANTEAYASIQENPFFSVAQAPLSTFSIDVDTASYSNVRRFLNEGRLPPPGAVRIEELLNSFTYDYAPPRGPQPFAVHVDATTCPWAKDHLLARIALKGREIEPGQRPPTNLVFLIDVSGSMDSPDKLPLLKRAMTMLVKQLDQRDHVAIVVYAGASGLVLPSTSAANQRALLDALERLDAGGSTHGAAGIRLAYEVAAQGFIRNGVNRVILATDGDFNVGVTSQDELVRLIEDKARSGVFLTVLGFGTGNVKDATLEQLADHGNGQYAYIDSFAEARRMLVDQIGGTLVTIAKDVKIQVELNPRRVAEYRLIGYENRVLENEDFEDDTKDAGEIGAGHTVTALYELVPVGAASVARTVPALKYQKERAPTEAGTSNDLLTVKLRYKQPDGDRSILLEKALAAEPVPFARVSPGMKFAAAVASFGMALRQSPHRGSATLADVVRWGREGLGADDSGQRAEFLALVRQAKALLSEERVE